MKFKHTIVVLDGESWVDRSSFLGTIDLLQILPTMTNHHSDNNEWTMTNIETINLDEKNSYESLKLLLKKATVLVCCGGRPQALLKALGNKGKTLLKQ